MFFPKIIRQNSSLILSLLLGIGLSYIYTSFQRNECQDVDTFYNPIQKNVDKDLYEPKINLAGKPQRAKKVPKSFVRPRYYSTELGIKDKIFIAVLTESKTVREFAVAFNRTTSHLVDKLMFFMDAAGAEKAKVVDLKLPGIVGFVDTKELLKPFHTLKYLTDNFLEEYDFFFLTKDTTYVDAEALGQILKKISVSENIHAGSVLTSDSSVYCSLDGGILISNSVLRKIQPSLDWCVKNAYYDSHDDNIGRCILHASLLPCTNDIQGVKLESKSLKNVTDLNSIEQVLSYYPISSQEQFYKLHLIFSQIKLAEAKLRLSILEKKLDKKNSTWPPGSYPPNPPPTRFDVLGWQYFDMEHIYLPDDFTNLKPLSGSDLKDAMIVVNRSVEWVLKRYPGELRYRKLINGYRRFDPSRGLDYILDLSFRDNHGGAPVKRVEVSKPLGRVETLQMPYVTENSRVVIILPLFASDKIYGEQFMNKYSESCSQTELTSLILILLYEAKAPGKGHHEDVFKEVKANALRLSSLKHKDCKINWISIRVPDFNGLPPLEDNLLYFAMTDLLTKRLPDSSMILYSEPSIEFRQDYFKRVRMGTIIGTQIYSPIPFSEYSPLVVYRNASFKAPSLEIHKTSGQFDISNDRHISFYLSDYLSARASITYLPVVKSDKDIYKLFWTYFEDKRKEKISSLLDLFSRREIHVLRAAEPSLRLRRLNCRSRNSKLVRTTQYSRCDSPLGTRSQLGQIVLDYKGNSSKYLN